MFAIAGKRTPPEIEGLPEYGMHRRYNRLNAFGLDCLAILLSGFALFFLTPLYLTAYSDSGVEDFDLGIMLIAAAVCFAFYSIFLLIAVIFGGKSKYRGLISVSSIFLMIWVVTSTLLTPISEHSGMISPDAVSINITNLLIVATTAVALTFLGVTRIFWIPYIFSGVLVIGVTIEMYAFFSNIPNTNRIRNNETLSEFSALSTNRNIIVLSFDGIPGNVIADLFENNNEITSEFKDFKFFYNAFSSAPATRASIKSELFGNRIYRKNGFDGGHVSLDFEKPLLPLNYLKNSYTYGAYSEFRTDKTKRLNRGDFFSNRIAYSKIQDSFYRLELSITRTIGSFGFRVLRRTGLFSHARRATQALYFFNHPPSEFDYVAMNYKNPAWKLGSTLEVYDFYEMVDSLRVDSDENNEKPYLRMMHFTHTHFPVDFDKHCVIRSTDKHWVETNQNYRGLYNEGFCQINQFILFIKKLKALGVYNNTLIVLKSDHGAPASYFNSGPHSLKINGHPAWGVNRYMPVLLIKNFGSAANVLHRSDLLVGLPDLARTICNASQIGNCELFAGVDLVVASEAEITSNPYIFVDVVKDKDSSHSSDTHKSLKLDRRGGGTIRDLFRRSEAVDLGRGY